MAVRLNKDAIDNKLSTLKDVSTNLDNKKFGANAYNSSTASNLSNYLKKLQESYNKAKSNILAVRTFLSYYNTSINNLEEKYSKCASTEIYDFLLSNETLFTINPVVLNIQTNSSNISQFFRAYQSAGIQNSDILRIISGEITFEELEKEIASDETRKHKYFESLYFYNTEFSGFKELDSLIESFNEPIAKKKEEIKTLETELLTLNSKLTGLKRGHLGSSSDAKNLEAQIKTIGEKLEKLRDELGGLENKQKYYATQREEIQELIDNEIFNTDLRHLKDFNSNNNYNSSNFELIKDKGLNTLSHNSQKPKLRLNTVEDQAAFLSYMINEKNTYLVQNKNHEFVEVSGGLIRSMHDYIPYMDEKEKENFNYIYNTKGANEAVSYLKSLEKILDTRWLRGYGDVKGQIELDKEFAREDPYLASIASVIMTPMEGIKASLNSVGAVTTGDDITRRSVYSHGNVFRGEVSTMIGEKSDTWAFIYSTGMSMADTGLMIAASVCTGGVAGAGGIAGTAANLALSSALMGSRAYVSTLNEALDRGLTDGKAVLLAASSAVVETAMESYSLGHLMGLEKHLGNATAALIKSTNKKGVQVALTFVAGAVSQGIAEGEEEFATEILNRIADDLISGDLSNYALTIERYMEEGLSEQEAIKKANNDYRDQLVQAFAGGFASGVCFGLGGAVRISTSANVYSASQMNNSSYDGTKAQAYAEGFALSQALAENGLSLKDFTQNNVSLDLVVDNKKGTTINDILNNISNESSYMENAVNGLKSIMNNSSAQATINSEIKEAVSAQPGQDSNVQNKAKLDEEYRAQEASRTLEQKIEEANMWASEEHGERRTTIPVTSMDEITFDILSKFDRADLADFVLPDGTKFTNKTIIDQYYRASLNNFSSEISEDLKEAASVSEVVDIEEEILTPEVNKLMEEVKNTPLHTIAGKYLSQAVSILSRYRYTSVTTNQAISEKITSGGLYHITSEESAAKILESGYVKASDKKTSYGKEKTFFFTEGMSLEDVAFNIENHKAKQIAVKFDVSESEVDQFKYRDWGDNAVTFEGNYNFENGKAKIVYLALTEENGKLVYKEVTKAQYDAIDVNPSSSILEKLSDAKLQAALAANSEYETAKTFISAIKTKLSNFKIQFNSNTQNAIITSIVSSRENSDIVRNLNSIVSKEGTISFYHGGLDSDISLENVDLTRLATKQQKQGRNYAGFYMYDQTNFEAAEDYAKQSGKNGIHKIEIDATNLKIYEVDPFSITRITADQIEELQKAGYDLIAGRMLGKTEYILLNKNIVKSFDYLKSEESYKRLESSKLLDPISKSESLASKEAAIIFNDSKQFLFAKALEIINNYEVDSIERSKLGDKLKNVFHGKKCTANINESELFKLVKSQLTNEELETYKTLKNNSVSYSEAEKGFLYSFAETFGPALSFYDRKTSGTFKGALFDGNNIDNIYDYVFRSLDYAVSKSKGDINVKRIINALKQKIGMSDNYIISKEEKIKIIDKLSNMWNEIFDKSPRTTENLTVYRGVAGIYLDNGKINLPDIGTRFNDSSTISTSAINSIISSTNKIIMEIEVPKGSKAVYVEANTGAGRYGQQELVLPKGSTFEVISKPTYNSQGQLVLKCKLVEETAVAQTSPAHVNASYFNSYIFDKLLRGKHYPQIETNDFYERINVEQYNAELDYIKSHDLYNNPYPNHGIDHISRVLQYSMYLSEIQNLSEADKSIIRRIASLHDVGASGLDHSNHGAKGASIIYNMLMNESVFSKEDIGIISAIVESHETNDRVLFNNFEAINNLRKNNEISQEQFYGMLAHNATGFKEICEKYGVLESEYARVVSLMSIIKDADAVDRVRFVGLDGALTNTEILRTNEGATLIKTASEIMEANAFKELNSLLENGTLTEDQIQEINNQRNSGYSDYAILFNLKYKNVYLDYKMPGIESTKSFEGTEELFFTQELSNEATSEIPNVLNENITVEDPEGRTGSLVSIGKIVDILENEDTFKRFENFDENIEEFGHDQATYVKAISQFLELVKEGKYENIASENALAKANQIVIKQEAEILLKNANTIMNNINNGIIPEGFETLLEYKKHIVKTIKDSGMLEDPSVVPNNLYGEFLFDKDILKMLLSEEKTGYLLSRNLDQISIFKKMLSGLSSEEVNTLFSSATIKNCIANLSAEDAINAIIEFEKIGLNVLVDSEVFQSKFLSLPDEELYDYLSKKGYRINNALQNSLDSNKAKAFYDSLVKRVMNDETIKSNPKLIFKLLDVVPYNKDGIYNETKALVRNTTNQMEKNMLNNLVNKTAFEISENGKVNIHGYFDIVYKVDGQEFTKTFNNLSVHDFNILTLLVEGLSLEKACLDGKLEIIDIIENQARNSLILQNIEKGLYEINLLVNGEEKTVVINNKYGNQIDLNNKFIKQEITEAKVLSTRNIGNYNFVPDEVGKIYKIDYNTETGVITEYKASYDSSEIDINLSISSQNISGIQNVNVTKIDNPVVEVQERIKNCNVREDVFSDGKYGGRQEDIAELISNEPTNEIERIKKDNLFKILHSYFPNVSQEEATNIAKACSRSGCGYIAVANAFINDVLNKDLESAFSEKFGFELYETDGENKYFNQEYIAFDMFLDNFTRQLKCESIEVLLKKATGLANIDYESTTESYFKSKGFIVESTHVVKDLKSKGASMVGVYKDFISTKNGSQLIIGDTGFDLALLGNEDLMGSMDESLANSKQEGNTRKDVGSHAMYITGITDDGKLLVSSWGKKCIYIPTEKSSPTIWSFTVKGLNEHVEIINLS